MMEFLRSYLLKILVLAMVIQILTLISEKSGSSTLTRMLGALVLVLTMLQPLAGGTWATAFSFTDSVSSDAEQAAAYGQEITQQQMRDIIKEQTEAYILDKARVYDAQLEVEVTLEEASGIPNEVCVRGMVSPYAKSQLQKLIAEELGIGKECQQWIG